MQHGYNISINTNELPKYEAYMRNLLACDFFKSVSQFQQMAVSDWNKTRDDVTLSYNMGFVGVHEDSSDGAANVILDMLLKFGVLVYDQNETWALHGCAKFRRLYCFGDHKTIENRTAFVNKLSTHSLSFKQFSWQAEIFLDAFKLVMFLPGDWHTGLNMLLSIYKIFWSDLLVIGHGIGKYIPIMVHLAKARRWSKR